MSKLKNSYEEHQQIVGGLGAGNNNSSHSGWAPRDVYNRSNHDNSLSFHQQNSYNQTNSGISVRPSSGFVMPKIKYRHIEDQNPSNLQNTTSRV